MWELSENSLVTFFAGEAQIFGALLGLLGLSFVRGAENIERNFAQHLNSLVTELMELVQRIENTDDLHIAMKSTADLGAFIEKYRAKIPSEKYKSLRYQFDELEKEAAAKRALSRRFKVNCWLSFGLIVAASAALISPLGQYPAQASLFALFLFSVSALALVLATLFFIEITKTTSVFVFGKS